MFCLILTSLLSVANVSTGYTGSFLYLLVSIEKHVQNVLRVW